MGEPAEDRAPDDAAAINAFGGVLPADLPAVLDAVLAPVGNSEVVVYLADFAHTVLQPCS